MGGRLEEAWLAVQSGDFPLPRLGRFDEIQYGIPPLRQRFDAGFAPPLLPLDVDARVRLRSTDRALLCSPRDRVAVQMIVSTSGQVLLVRSRKVVVTLGPELEDSCRDLRDKPSIMRHEEQRAVVLLQGAHQRLDGLEIQVIGGLIE